MHEMKIKGETLKEAKKELISFSNFEKTCEVVELKI